MKHCNKHHLKTVRRHQPSFDFIRVVQTDFRREEVVEEDILEKGNLLINLSVENNSDVKEKSNKISKSIIPFILLRK